MCTWFGHSIAGVRRRNESEKALEGLTSRGRAQHHHPLALPGVETEEEIEFLFPGQEDPQDRPASLGALSKWGNGGSACRAVEEGKLPRQVGPDDLQVVLPSVQRQGALPEIDGYRELGATPGVETPGTPAKLPRIAAWLGVDPKAKPVESVRAHVFSLPSLQVPTCVILVSRSLATSPRHSPSRTAADSAGRAPGHPSARPRLISRSHRSAGIV